MVRISPDGWRELEGGQSFWLCEDSTNRWSISGEAYTTNRLKDCGWHNLARELIREFGQEVIDKH